MRSAIPHRPRTRRVSSVIDGRAQDSSPIRWRAPHGPRRDRSELCDSFRVFYRIHDCKSGSSIALRSCREKSLWIGTTQSGAPSPHDFVRHVGNLRGNFQRDRLDSVAISVNQITRLNLTAPRPSRVRQNRRCAHKRAKQKHSQRTSETRSAELHSDRARRHSSRVLHSPGPEEYSRSLPR